MTPSVHRERDADIAVIVINNPPINAGSAEVRRGLLAAKCDKAAARRFFDKAMQANGVPEKITMGRSGANKAAIDEINASSGIPIIVRH